MSLIFHAPLTGIDTLTNYVDGSPLAVAGSMTNLVVSEGVVGTSIARTGADGSYLTGPTVNLNGKSFTMMAWIKPTGGYNVGTANGIMSNHSYAANAGAGITLHTPSTTACYLSCSTGNGADRTYMTYYGTTNLHNVWSHVVLRYDAPTTTCTLWVNGEVERTFTYAMYCIPSPIELFSWSVGYANSSYKPLVAINDARVYDHACSVSEIKEVSKGLMLHWDFNSSGATANDWDLIKNTTSYSTLVPVDVPDPFGGRDLVNRVTGMIRIGDTGGVTQTLTPGKYWTFSCWLRRESSAMPDGNFDICDKSLGLYQIDEYGNILATYGTTAAMMSSISRKWQRYCVMALNDGPTGYRFIDIGLYQGTASMLMSLPMICCGKLPPAYAPVQLNRNSALADIPMVYDKSGFRNDGIAAGNSESGLPYLVGEGVGTSVGSTALHVRSREVNPNAPYVYVNSLYIPERFTISGWIRASYADQNAHNQYPFGWRNLCILGPALSSTSGRLGMIYYNTASGYTAFSANGDVYTGEWVHICNTVDTVSKTASMYLNGNLVATVGTDTVYHAKSFRSFIAGAAWQADYGGIVGSLNDIRVYATVLSPEDVKRLYEVKTSMDRLGTFTTSEAKEEYNVYDVVNQQMMGALPNTVLATYTQANCQVNYSIGKGMCNIYRPPNIGTGTHGNTMWGGMIVSPHEFISEFKAGETYRLQFDYCGKTSNPLDTPYFSYSAGWNSMGGLRTPTSTTEITPVEPGDTNGYWKTATYLISVLEDPYIVATNTSGGLSVGTIYNCMNQLKIGFGYVGSTGSLGTDLNISNLRLVKVASASQSDAKITSIKSTGETLTGAFTEGEYRASTVDYSDWVIGATTASRWNRNGSAAENLIRTDINPWGVRDVVWTAMNTDTASDADGGFDGTSFPVDPNRTYRFSIWLRREVIGNGSTYLGPGGSVETLAGTVNNNPYFYSAAAPGGLTEWVLLVSYVYAAGTTVSTYGDAGIYLPDGTKVGDMASFRWRVGTTSSYLRSYLYYSTDPGTVQHFYRPRVDDMTTYVPELSDILVGAENPVILDKYDSSGQYSSNVSRIRKIGNMNVTSLTEK